MPRPLFNSSIDELERLARQGSDADRARVLEELGHRRIDRPRAGRLHAYLVKALAAGSPATCPLGRQDDATNVPTRTSRPRPDEAANRPMEPPAPHQATLWEPAPAPPAAPTPPPPPLPPPTDHPAAEASPLPALQPIDPQPGADEPAAPWPGDAIARILHSDGCSWDMDHAWGPGVIADRLSVSKIPNNTPLRTDYDPARVASLPFARSGQIVKAIMALTGMIRGMPIERPLNDAEIDHCHTFVKEQWALFERSGKAGVLHDFLDAIVDVTLTAEERDHLLTALAQADEAYYDAITRHLQELHGLLGFAAADRQIEPHEVAALRTWVTDNVGLAGTWPYDDIVLLVDGLVERQMDEAIQVLLRYAKSFEGRSLAPSTPLSVETGEALFTSSPRPIVPGRVVCITGGSIFMPRSSIARLLASVGARWNRTPSSEVDLILVCGQGNQAWAHGNYGRKLEHVIERRRRGDMVDVVDEPTFWPLMRQAGAEVPQDLP